jgi:hypothetical protein
MTHININWSTKSQEQPLKQLSKRIDDIRYKDRPHIPLHARPKPTAYQDKTANELTKAIIAFIEIQGGIGERINSMGKVIDNRKTYQDPITNQTKMIGSIDWVKGTSTEGTADISATVFGLSIKVEVKIGKDKQSEAQKKYQNRVEQAGGLYIIARSFEGFLYEFLKGLINKGVSWQEV